MLVVPENVLSDISEIVAQKRGLETGVSLFGVRLEPAQLPIGTIPEPNPRKVHVVLAVAGPGPRALHEPSRYAGDSDFSTAIYWVLESALPGITWLGELHIHPRGMTWLSNQDLKNVREILLGSDGTLRPEEVIAGVMQRTRGSLTLYPRLFSRNNLEGISLAVRYVERNAAIIQAARTFACGGENDRPHICTQSERGAGPLLETHRRRWSWKFWKRTRNDGHTSGRRQADAR